MEQIIITHLDGSTLKLQSKASRSTITSAKQTVELLGNDVVDVTVESATKLNFYIGDKTTIIGRDYALNTPAKERKISESHFVYDLQLEGVQYDLLRATYSVNVDTTNNQIQDLNGESLTGDIKRFLDVLISNANRVFPGKWTLGTYPVGTETKTLTFGDSDNCLSVLQNLCGEDNYNTEFNIIIDGSGNRTLNVGTVGTIQAFNFEYGKGKGIYELTREKSSTANIITRLNVFGGSKNIMTSKYRAFKLCLPGKTKSQSYIENSTAITKYGIWENTKNFDNIFPSRVGTISALGDTELKFIDSSMDFDLNEKESDGITTKYLIKGTSAKVHFNTGNLAGYEFEITSYDHSTKQFTVIPFTDENGYRFPSETSSAFKFAAGDKYVILDIYLPQSYIDIAESKLQTAGQAFLDKYCQPRVQYGLTIDDFYFKMIGANPESNILWAGDSIHVKDTDLEIDKLIRIKGFSRDLLRDFSYSVTISDIAISVSTISRIISDLNDFDKVIKINNLNDIARAQLNVKTTRELLTMLESLRVEMLLVGDDAANYEASTVFTANYESNYNQISSTAGVLNHFVFSGTAGNAWNIQSFSAIMPDNDPYYVYVKASKTDNTATLELSKTKISVEEVSGYYYFPYGILSSPVSGVRLFTSTKGFTQITGDSIRTGRISDINENLIIDFNTATIIAKDGATIKGVVTFERLDGLPTDNVPLKEYLDRIGNGETVDTSSGYVSGAIIWQGGLTWKTVNFKYKILGVVYTCTDRIITAADADPNLPRIDQFVGDTFSNVELRTGTPNVNPTSPNLGAMELGLNMVYISPGALEPSNVDIERVYDEHTVEEWTATPSNDTNITVNLDSTDEPMNGSKCAKISIAIPDEVVSYPTHYIGEKYQGGRIFYLFPGTNGKRGYISAETDTAQDVFWSRLSDYPSYTTGANGVAIGTGKSNTEKMLLVAAAAGQAVKFVNELVIDGYDDWFMASEKELYEMWLRRFEIGDMGTKVYWSSTEVTGSSDWKRARAIDFGTGAAITRDKNNRYYVRAIREFDDTTIPTNQPVEAYTPTNTSIVFEAPDAVAVQDGIISLNISSDKAWRANSILMVEAYDGAVRIGSTAISPAIGLFGYRPEDAEWQTVAIQMFNLIPSKSTFDALKFSLTGSWPNNINLKLDDIRYQYSEIESDLMVPGTYGKTTKSVVITYNAQGKATAAEEIDTVPADGTVTALKLGADVNQTLADLALDKVDPIPDTTLGYEGTTIKLTAAVNMAFGDVGYIQADGKVAIASAAAEATAAGVVMCAQSTIAADAEGTFLLYGVARNDAWTWTVGGGAGLVYLSTTGTTGNTLAQTVVAAEDQVSQILGFATHANRVFFNPLLIQTVYKA